MARRPPARATSSTQAPETNSEIMFLLGKLVEGTDQINRRLDEQAGTQQQLAAAVEELMQDNAKQHQATAQQLGALGSDVAVLQSQVATLTQTGSSPGRKEGEKAATDPLKKADEAGELVRKWVPRFFLGGGAVAGFIYTLYQLIKGGTPKS